MTMAVWVCDAIFDGVLMEGNSPPIYGPSSIAVRHGKRGAAQIAILGLSGSTARVLSLRRPRASNIVGDAAGGLASLLQNSEASLQKMPISPPYMAGCRASRQCHAMIGESSLVLVSGAAAVH